MKERKLVGDIKLMTFSYFWGFSEGQKASNKTFHALYYIKCTVLYFIKSWT